MSGLETIGRAVNWPGGYWHWTKPAVFAAGAEAVRKLGLLRGGGNEPRCGVDPDLKLFNLNDLVLWAPGTGTGLELAGATGDLYSSHRDY